MGLPMRSSPDWRWKKLHKDMYRIEETFLIFPMKLNGKIKWFGKVCLLQQFAFGEGWVSICIIDRSEEEIKSLKAMLYSNDDNDGKLAVKICKEQTK